jgi:hypothetical protein
MGSPSQDVHGNRSTRNWVRKQVTIRDSAHFSLSGL